MKDVTFTLYDRNTWPRSSHFDYYTKGFVKSVNSMTVRLDVTHFPKETKTKGLIFCPAFSVLTAQFIASLPEMCTNVDKDGNPGYFSYLNPNFTIFHDDDKTFSDCWSQYEDDFDAFYNNLLTDAETYKNKKGIKAKDGQPMNFFCISCVPWNLWTANMRSRADMPTSKPLSRLRDRHSETMTLVSRKLHRQGSMETSQSIHASPRKSSERVNSLRTS